MPAARDKKGKGFASKPLLADIVSTDLRILLVAINPAPLSLRVGHHFATPTNLFWKLLYAAGLTSRLFEPGEALSAHVRARAGAILLRCAQH